LPTCAARPKWASGLPATFVGVLDRFYRTATEALVGHDAIIDKLIGDQVMALFISLHTHAVSQPTSPSKSSFCTAASDSMCFGMRRTRLPSPELVLIILPLQAGPAVRTDSLVDRRRFVLAVRFRISCL
jgi:hypothetical protein